MDKLTLDKIISEQEDYFNKEIIDSEGNIKTKGQYNQILQSEGLGYWVDIYDGNEGKGFVIIEEKTENGTIYRKATNFGNEEYRNYDWTEIKEVK